MKISAVIEDGFLQFVLQPETSMDKALLAMVPKGDKATAELKRGHYYHCQGGWYRQGAGDEGLILVVRDGTE